MTGLSQHADNFSCQPFGSKQQRIAITRALAMRPQIIFFDESTSARDHELVGEVLGVTRNLAYGRDLTMLLVTHEMRLAHEILDGIWFSDQGRIVRETMSGQLSSAPVDERTRAFLSRFMD